MKKKSLFFLTLVSGFMLMAQASMADVFIKQKVHSGGATIMGRTQPEKEYVQTIWITADKMRSDQENESIITRLDIKRTFLLDHKNKIAREIPLDLSPEPGSKIPGGTGDMAELQNMMKNMMKMKLTVTETAEKKVINNWNCRKYLQTLETVMGTTTSEIWATEDIKVDPDLYARFTASLMLQQPGLNESMESIFQEMKKIKGMAVSSKTSMSVFNTSVESSTELIEYKETASPADVFIVPSDYRRESFLK